MAVVVFLPLREFLLWESYSSCSGSSGDVDSDTSKDAVVVDNDDDDEIYICSMSDI